MILLAAWQFDDVLRYDILQEVLQKPPAVFSFPGDPVPREWPNGPLPCVVDGGILSLPRGSQSSDGSGPSHPSLRVRRHFDTWVCPRKVGPGLSYVDTGRFELNYNKLAATSGGDVCQYILASDQEHMTG